MKELFASATVKLTAWYLAILMALSLTFSIVIYQISISEISTRLGVFENRFSPPPDNGQNNPGNFRSRQLHETEFNLLIGLFYTNLIILAVGGLGSYVLARRTLQPIEESHEAQARFTSDASHELRTPLAVMKSELEVALRSGSLSKNEMKEILESNLEEVNRLSDLSTALLKLSRNPNGEVASEKIQLPTFLDEVVSHPSIDKNRIRLSIPKNTFITADPTLIDELFMILLDNAQRYSPPESDITVKATKKRDNTTISFTNSGDGISEEDLPKVFDRFYRADKSRTGGHKQGYGLGLSLAKQIVDLHDADIYVESIPKQTTTLTVVFKK